MKKKVTDNVRMPFIDTVKKYNHWYEIIQARITIIAPCELLLKTILKDKGT